MITPGRLRPMSSGDDLILSADRMSIGRDPTCSVRLDFPAVSRLHAQLDQTNHGYVLHDLASRNGTFVNGERLGTAPHPLRDGDEITFAGTASFRFVDPSATPLAPAIGRLSGVWIEPESRVVWVDGQEVDPPLSARQQALIELLDHRSGKTVSRAELVAGVWGDVATEGVSAHAIDSLIKRLRARIRPLQTNGELIEVTRGRGVRLRR